MFQDTRRVAPKPSKRQLAKLDDQIERMYYYVASGVQIDIMDISKIYDAGRAALASGADLEQAMRATVQQLRKN